MNQQQPSPRGRFSRRRFVATSVAACLALAACGGSDGESGESTTPPAGSTEASASPSASSSPQSDTPTSDPTDDSVVGTTATPGSGVDPASVDRTATLTYGASYFGTTTNYDPHKVATAIANVYLFPVYDRLVHLTPAAEPIPGLATSWEFEEDGAVLAMTLREGVTFHDGEPFDAEAVKANIERGQTVEGSTVVGELAVISEVEIVDDLNIRLILSGPAASLPLVLSDRAGAMISPAAMDDPNLSAAPVGAGMYEVTEFELGARAVYTAYPEYWDKDAQLLNELVMVNVEDPVARVNGLRAGEFDATEIDAASAEDIEAAGMQVVSKSGLVYMNLYLNRTRSEFADVRVRQALNYAIDREAIVDTIAFGRGEVASQPFPKDYFAHSSEAEDLYPYDPDKAVALLEEAGLADGFAFDVIVPPADTYSVHAEAIQAYLAEVGIEMTISQNQDINKAFFVDQGVDAMFSIWTGRPDPQMTVGLLYTSEGFSNAGRQSTPEVEALQAEALATTDPAARQALLQDLSHQIMVDALAVPIYFTQQVVASQSGVVGLVPWTSGKTEFRGVGVAAS